MEKAFNFMEWPFLLNIFKALGFNQTWISWIKECITTVSYSILINGTPTNFFHPSRGLRQGDPLSPFLFILGSETLSRLILREETKKNLEDICLSRISPTLSHILFANDLILFGKATNQTTQTFVRCLDTYSSWSGQKINKGKSLIHLSNNTPTGNKREIKDILSFKESPPKLRYLSLLLYIGPSKLNIFKDILEKIQNRMQGWKTQLLSEAGRTTLIRTVASTIPSYAMTTMWMPKSISNRMDSVFQRF